MKEQNKITTKTWNIKLFKRILYYSKSFKLLLFGGLIITIFLSIISPLKPYIIGIIVGDYVRLSQYQELFNGAILVIIILIFEAIGQFSLSYIANDLGQRVIKKIRDELFAHISNFKLKYFDNNPIGMLVSRVISDIETISDIFSQGILLIVGDILKLIGVLLFMLFINWKLTLIVLIPIPILIIATTLFK
ncbi:MAG: ABC transporter ATP-binding protein, partial [Flavobacteriales bacterium]|nr:ABC transporter ATP-binding protein [Flavobacteriales bacterium]